MTSPEALAGYVDELFTREPPLLAELRETLDAGSFPAIQVPPRTGRLLELIARLSGARRVLEIGTLGGYSALWLLRGMPSDGRILTIEKEPEHVALAREFLERAGESERVEIRVENARDLVPRLGPDGGWDLVFIDADKEGYVTYLQEAARLLRPGGVLLADNAFWHGRVVEDDDDPATRGVRSFNSALAESREFDATVLPVGDGVALGVRVRPAV